MMHSRHAFIRTPNDRFSSSSMKTPRSGRKIIKSKGKSWDSTNSDLNRYKLSPEEIMRRKQVRSTPVNSGPIVRSSIKKAKKQPEKSAALTPSRTPVARDNSGNVTWVPTGRNTTVRTPKVTNVQVTSPSTMESKFDLLENEEDMGVLSRVQSHHSSLSKANKAWERSRIERSAAKKAAAAIAKAESKVKTRSLQINHVDMNRLEQSFYELQGQLDKIRNMTGRPRTWCNVNVSELGNEKSIVSYVDTLGKTLKGVCEMLSEQAIRIEQGEELQKAFQDNLAGVQMHMLRIRDEQERHAGVLEYLVAEHRNNEATRKTMMTMEENSRNNNINNNSNNHMLQEQQQQMATHNVEVQDFDDEEEDDASSNQFADVEGDNYATGFTPEQQFKEDVYAFEEMKKEIATFSNSELVQLLNSEGVQVDEKDAIENIDKLREMVLNIIQPDISSYSSPPMPTPRSAVPEAYNSSNGNTIGRFVNYKAYMYPNSSK